MVIGILQFELFIHDPESIKDKRRVVKSLKDRLHREHMVSVAEVADQDVMGHAVLGLACVGTDGKRVGEVLDHVSEKLRGLIDAEVGEIRRTILHGSALPASAGAEGLDEAALAEEMLRRAREDGEPGQ